MENRFNLNIILKILTVFIVGYFIFDLIFSLITGAYSVNGSMSGGSSHHASGGGGILGYSLEAIVNGLLILLVRLMTALFFIMIIAGVSKWMKEMTNSNEKKESKLIKGNSYKFNTLLILLGSVISILVAVSIFDGLVKGSIGYNYYPYLRGIHLINPFSTTLNSYGLLKLILNIVIYSTAIVLGIEVYIYLRKFIERLTMTSCNEKDNNLVQGDSHYLYKKENIE